MTQLERLDKIIASQGKYSRKDVKRLVKHGDVLLNGEIVRSSDIKIDPACDKIVVMGEEVMYQKYVYYMMNKPKGVLSASTDRNAQTVVDLLPPDMQRRNLFPAGRLDKDTTGLLIITDDGDFAHRMLSPNKKVYKHYIATVDKPLDNSVKERFENGIVLKDGTVCQKAFFEIIDDYTARVQICEGKFHQVKKMFLACSYMVLKLKRVQIGQLVLDDALEYGESRSLTKTERQAVFYRKND